MYVLGIDGGGTKTQCYIGDLNGNILGEGLSGSSNYQMCGEDNAKASISQATEDALKKAHLELHEISSAVLGLSGADESIDFEILKKICKEIYGDISHFIINDAWIGLRSGSEYGVVSICGTGGAHAGMNIKGETIIFRNLDYLRGNLDGAKYIVKEALHYAFRSNEGTYKKSELELIVPSILNVETMDDVSRILRSQKPNSLLSKLPIEIFNLALEGDLVSKMILSDMGASLGKFAACIVKKLRMEKGGVPIVLIGSIFKNKNSILIDSYLSEVQKVAMGAYTIIPDVPPVKGAYFMAIDKIRSENKFQNYVAENNK